MTVRFAKNSVLYIQAHTLIVSPSFGVMGLERLDFTPKGIKSSNWVNAANR